MTHSSSPRTPSYRRQKGPDGPGRAFVDLNGRRHYLGRYGSPESREAYDRLIGEWLGAGRREPIRPAPDLTITELIASYLRHVDTYYVKNGRQTTEVHTVRAMLRPLRRLYGSMAAEQFGPAQLKVVQRAMIRMGWSRPHINKQVSRLRSLYKWAGGEGLIDGVVYHRLQVVPALKRGRCEAREPEPVRPVPLSDVDAALGHLPKPLAALVRLQLLTGARAGELVIMRPVDLVDTSGSVWVYVPAEHKTEHHGIERLIYLGPRAQAIVRPFLADRPIDAYLFSPRESEAERHAACSKHRRPDQRPNEKKTDRNVGDRYSTDSYRRAIERACRAVGVSVWTPHRLRHSAATAIRRDYGIEMAQVILGHRLGSRITEVYAEADREKAAAVMRKIG